jgi:hypothetical protein
MRIYPPKWFDECVDCYNRKTRELNKFGYICKDRSCKYYYACSRIAAITLEAYLLRGRDELVRRGEPR